MDEVSAAGQGCRGETDLGLFCPVLDVFDCASTAGIDVSAGTDEEVWGGDDIGDRRVARVVLCEPDRDGDVVGRAPEGDWEEAVQTEEKLGAAIVIRCGAITNG